MKERPLSFGRQPALVAVLTEPLPSKARPSAPVCILVNAGLVHRVGPNRLHVELARRLARSGYRALRMDLSGRGDSEIRRDGKSFLESAPLEIQGAMDHLQQTTGADRFVVMGICSGAINSLQTAIADSRVTGCIAIDPPAYPTRGFYLRHYAGRLLNRQSWANTFAGRNALGRWLGFGSGAAPEGDVEDVDELYTDRPPRPSRQEVSDQLLSVARRGAKMLFIFSGSWSSYKYRNQFRDGFPDVAATGQADLEYFPDSDHTFSSLYNQKRLLNLLLNWFESNWPGQQAARGGAPV